MSILDLFRIKKIKEELVTVKNENQLLIETLTPEHSELLQLKKAIQMLTDEENRIKEDINKLQQEFLIKSNEANVNINILNNEITNKKNQLLVLDEQIMLESFSHYEPKFEFTNSTHYKNKLDEIRTLQKTLIKNGTACTGNTNWTVNNSKSQGNKMVKDMIKLVLRSFNNECDSCVQSVKFNNIHTHEKRITASYEALNKLGIIMNVEISRDYLKLKFSELYLAHEYQLKKQEEKEEQKQLREQMREEAKMQKEIEELKRTVEKEQKHYNNALAKLNNQLASCTDAEERTLLNEKLQDLLLKLEEIDKQIKDIDYREANQRAGYVYVISNIGAFGENVFKIGMTRRLNPYDRISELGDASVPFNFDVHAMIFSDDAPTLETTLHKAFEGKRLNYINRRREYFNVSLDEIENVIKNNHDQTVEFIKTAPAEEYRESKLLINHNQLSLNNITSSYREVAATKL